MLLTIFLQTDSQTYWQNKMSWDLAYTFCFLLYAEITLFKGFWNLFALTDLQTDRPSYWQHKMSKNELMGCLALCWNPSVKGFLIDQPTYWQTDRQTDQDTCSKKIGARSLKKWVKRCEIWDPQFRCVFVSGPYQKFIELTQPL